MRRFTDYRIYVLIPVSAIAVQLGIWWGASHYADYIRTEGSADIREVERWKGLTQGLVPWTMTTVGLAILVVWRLMPSPAGNDAAALAKLARQKLGEPLLTEAETDLWTRVLEEVEDEFSA
ncbi:MAG: hypothetical protein AAFY20_10595 [Cyanobacteria bacterium J06639_14]